MMRGEHEGSTEATAPQLYVALAVAENNKAVWYAPLRQESQPEMISAT